MHAITVSFLLAGTMALTGCSMLPFGGSNGGGVSSQDPSANATKDAAAEPDVPKTPAQEFSVKLNDSLRKLAATTKAPNREQMKTAMAEAGANPDTTEISVDITPTGLAVDAIEAAVPVDNDCVIGQVRDGNVAVAILPILDSGRCFIGDVH